MTALESTLEPPGKPPVVATGFTGDEIEELGDKIASLRLLEAVLLEKYLQEASNP